MISSNSEKRRLQASRVALAAGEQWPAESLLFLMLNLMVLLLLLTVGGHNAFAQDMLQSGSNQAPKKSVNPRAMKNYVSQTGGADALLIGPNKLDRNEFSHNREVTLRVRTINALHSNSSAGVPGEKEIDGRLRDLQDRFESLPYNKFTLRSSELVDVPLKRKSSVRLPDGHTLTFRVLYRNEKKLGLWLDWLDDMGMMVLNSKVHLNCHDPFLAGTDNVRGGGLLLAVAVED